MKRCKYVILNHCFPILFSEANQHSEFKGMKLGEPTSAGFCMISGSGDQLTVSTFGDSFSLKMKPAPGDDVLIKRLFEDC